MSAVLPTYARFDLTFDRGEGTFLITEDGERYLDFASGVAVNVLGHAHPDLVAALTEQAGKVWHTSNLFKIPGQEQLAKRLCEATFADKVFFTNSGAEAMECAIKMARRFHHVNGAGERFRMIALEGAFHGRTLATIAAGGQDKLLDGFGPPVDGFDHVPPGDLDAVEAAIGPETAAILAEPIQGEGGVRALSSDYLKGLREICDSHGILLILDEIQCGMGRTGVLFAHELAGITPDIMAIAKGIGGGFPVGACLATDNAAKGMVAGTHGSTYGGNPLAMAVASAVLSVVQEPGFLDEVKRKSLRFKQLLAQLRDEHGDIIEGVRGEGLMIGLKLKVAPKDLVAALIEVQMLTVPAGDNVVRLLPPLNVGDDDLVDAASRIDRACALLKAKAVSEPESINN